MILKFYGGGGGGTGFEDDTPDMVINSVGKIGINTDNPLSLLTVAADSASAEIELKRTNTNTTGSIGAINWTAMDGHSVANMWAKADGDNEGAHIVFKTTTAAAEQDPFGTSTVERVRIKSDGITQITNAGEATYGTGVTAINIGNGMNVSLADDASFTMSSICNTGGLIAVGTTKDSSGNIRYRHGLFFAQYGSTSVTEISDTENTFATSDSDGYVCVYATSSVNGNVVIKNRLGHTSNICVTVVRFLGN